MNQYSESHKKLSDFELIEIINNPSEYAKPAIESAKEEIRNRRLNGLFDENVQSNYETFIQSNSKKAAVKVEDKVKQVEEIFKKRDFGDIFIYTFSAVFGIILLTLLFLLLVNYVEDNKKNTIEFLFGLGFIVYFMVFDILYVMKKQIGWYFLTVIVTLIFEFTTYLLESWIQMFFSDEITSFSYNNYTAFTLLVLIFLLLVFFLIFQFSGKVRIKFKVSKLNTIITLILIVIVNLCVLFSDVFNIFKKSI